MTKKLTGAALAKFEIERDIWQEVLEGVREIKAGGGKRREVESRTGPRVRKVRIEAACPATRSSEKGDL